MHVVLFSRCSLQDILRLDLHLGCCTVSRNTLTKQACTPLSDLERSVKDIEGLFAKIGMLTQAFSKIQNIL